MAKVHSITLRAQIARRLRKAILEGSLAPGERLVERALAEQLGASLTAVREAIIQLEAEGLIKKKSNSTTHVTLLTRDEICQAFAVRRELERFAVAEATRRAGQEDFDRLTRLHGDAIEAAKARDYRLYVERDFIWHEALWSVAGNEVLTSTLRRVVVPLFGFSSIRIVSRKNFDLIEDTRTHDRILRALEAGDPRESVSVFDEALHEWQSQVLGEA